MKKNLTLSDNALTVLKRRYLARDRNGEVIETPAKLFARVANFIAEADRNYGADDEQIKRTARQFYKVMASLEFLPNSPTLMNAGRELGQLSACFVLPVEDSIEQIFEANKNAALIHKSGGGTGFSFSRLRPRNSIVASTSGVASGPVSFMKVFNAATEEIKQGGTRRGANMGILRVDHPDILEFIRCKSETGEITNFNISIAVTDAFMQAVKTNQEYALIDPRTGHAHEVEGQDVRLNACEVFDLIVDRAWQTGEPGIVFIDRMNRLNPTFPHELIEATNPCGEQPLPAYDSCNLGSINLNRFVLDPLPSDYSDSSPEGGIAWDRLAAAVRTGVHFLDNVIDQNRYPLPIIEKQTRKNRRIGLGVMGLADMFVRLELPYNSPAAFELGEYLMAFVRDEARKHSSELAKGRGRFPNWEKSVFAKDNVAMRNATTTTIAPTGSISIIAGCSSGIEPFYAVAFERNVLDGARLVESNPIFEQMARDSGFYSEELMKRVAKVRSVSGIEEIPRSIRKLFVTAADISAKDHIRMQAAFQKQVDSSVSKTINFPETAGRGEVAKAFRLAFETGCKGCTVYRDNSRPGQVLSTIRPVTKASAKERPRSLPGFTEKIKTGYGNLYVTVTVKDGLPFEVFAQIGKSGFTTMADTEAISRLISLALRSGVSVAQIIRQLRGIGGSSQVFADGSRVFSIPDAIAQVLNRHFSPPRKDSSSQPDEGEICPECGQVMVFQSGCFSCQSCGYSSC